MEDRHFRWLALHLDLQQREQNLARPTNLHLFMPIFLNGTFANGYINKPTEIPSLELPCRTLFLTFKRRFLNNPGSFNSLLSIINSKNNLSGDFHGVISTIALNFDTTLWYMCQPKKTTFPMEFSGEMCRYGKRGPDHILFGCDLP